MKRSPINKALIICNHTILYTVYLEMNCHSLRSKREMTSLGGGVWPITLTGRPRAATGVLGLVWPITIKEEIWNTSRGPVWRRDGQWSMRAEWFDWLLSRLWRHSSPAQDHLRSRKPPWIRQPPTRPWWPFDGQTTHGRRSTYGASDSVTRLFFDHPIDNKMVLIL